MKKDDTIPNGFTRVTEILKPYSKLDIIAPEVLANAARRGTRVHTYCEMHALNLFVDDYDEDCKNYVESFKSWYDLMVVKLHYNELRLNSAIYRISGKFDMIVQLKGDPTDCFTLLDIKTPSIPTMSWNLQTAAYRILIRDEMGITIDRRICLMLPKDGARERVIEFKNHEKEERLFLNALEIYRFFN